MKERIFLYKILLNLRNHGMDSINLDDLFETHEYLLTILDSYKLDYYFEKFKNEKKFELLVYYLILDYDLGIYNKDTNTLTFNQEISITESLLSKELIDISDKLLNELSMLLAFEIDEQTKKQLNI